MSDDTTTADAIAFAQSIFINNCCGYTALALLFYEYAITLDREVNLFWTRRPTGASVLFFVNRYTPLLLQIVDLCGYANMSDRVGQESTLTIRVLKVFSATVFSGLRVYALSRRNAFLGLATFLLSAVTVGLNLTQYRWLTGYNDPDNGCTNQLLIPDNLLHPFVITSRTCLIAADLIAIAVTWAATYRVRTLSLTQSLGHSFSAILLEYATSRSSLNRKPHSKRSTALSPSPFLPAHPFHACVPRITAILISRFLFNLQEANQGPGTGSTLSDSESLPPGTSGSHTDTLIFARVAGPLGSPLISRDETTYPEEHSMKSVVDADTTMRDA
ncbi:hypothetical protein C8Q79DRAFT_956175 [Trametes meyenii]|nr:hypothetical protein C8Q79DRAFT_956175 [Trametes meyenii]